MSCLIFFLKDSRGSSNGTPAVSKWEMMEQTEEKLGNPLQLILQNV